MPKLTINNLGLGGLSPNSDVLEGSFTEAVGVDPYRKPGYIMPGFAETIITQTVTTDLILDAVLNPVGSDVYGISNNKLYRLPNWGASITNTTAFPYSITAGGASAASEVFAYNASGTSYLYWIGQNDIGRYDYAGNYDEDWGSTAPTGAASLQTAPHPKIEFNSIYWIGNGRYLCKLEAKAAGTQTTMNAVALDLGFGWEITTLFTTQNYIGVCAWVKQNAVITKTQCAVFMWDGVSETYNYKIPINDNKIISSINNSGEIFLITEGNANQASQCSLKKLIDNGSESISKLRVNLSGTDTSFTITHNNAIDVFDERLLFGLKSITQNYLFSYGSPIKTFSDVLSIPYFGANASATCDIGLVKNLNEGAFCVSHQKDGVYKWSRYSTGNSVATWKGVYQSFGQKIRINYIKFYFRPLVASDSITVGLDIDYGTSVTLADNSGNATITYTNDGAITSKKFKVGRDCHTFRPTIAWGAGGTPFNRICIDYTFIEDN